MLSISPQCRRVIQENGAGETATASLCLLTRFSAWVYRTLAYATSSHSGTPHMKGIPVHAVWIAELHGE